MTEIDVKRLFVPGVVLKADCPACGAPVKYDLGEEHYLSYPVINEPTTFGFFCHECSNEWDVPILVTLTVQQLTGPQPTSR